MSILNVIRGRKSVRKYKEDPIPEEVFSRVMEAARLAPSGKNLQPWKFIVIKNQELKENIAEVCRGQMFMAQAPLIIAACGFPDECYAHQGQYMRSWPIDVAIAVEHLMLQAWEEGLGSCWIGAFNEVKVKELLNVPDNVRVLALTPLGYPAEDPRDRGRKALGEILSFESY